MTRDVVRKAGYFQDGDRSAIYVDFRCTSMASGYVDGLILVAIRSTFEYCESKCSDVICFIREKDYIAV